MKEDYILCRKRCARNRSFLHDGWAVVLIITVGLIGLSSCLANPGNLVVSRAQAETLTQAELAQGVREGARTESEAPNYLALQDQIGPSGVPLGGIGAGYVQFAPDGHFTRSSAVNNWCSECVTTFCRQNVALENLHFLAIWDRMDNSETVSRRLQRDTLKTCGLPAYEHSVYRGLFPTAQVYFNHKNYIYFTDPEHTVPSAASVRAWSGLVPRDLKDSAIPGFWVEVEVTNNTGSRETAVALSWADLIGRGLLEPKDPKTIPISPLECNPSYFREVPRPVTVGRPATAQGWQGVLQTVAAPLPAPTKLTFQAAVTQVLVLAEPQPEAEITVLPAYSLDNSSSTWETFKKDGKFVAAGETNLSGPGRPPAASAVAIEAKIPEGGKRTFRFLVLWYAPPITPDPARADDPRYRYGKGDYGAWYQNNFSKVEDVAAYAIAGRERIWKGIRSWQDPILTSDLPDWLKFKLINSAYTLFTNTFLNRAGDFSIMEGGMGGLASTMDVRNYVHPLYQKFFPEIDRHELREFAASQEPVVYPDGSKNDPRRVGAISHFLGHYFVGLSSTDTPGPVTTDVTLDGSGGYIMQLVNNYEQTGDETYVREAGDNIRRVIAYLKANIVDDRGIPDGRATFDDFRHPDVFSYHASMFLMDMEAAIRAGKVLKDPALVAECEQMREVARRGYFSLWNGRYFAYGANRGSRELDNRFHQGQVGGQSLARYCGWGEVVPMEMLNSVFTSQCKLVLSQVPDYYADKLWDISMNRGVDAPLSRCWPFTLEAFTAMPMIQAGWVEDGFDIMRHLQLVHLRNGWMWTQNLWIPGEVTRVDAPVTWMVLDNLAGAAVNVPEHRLLLGPGLIPGEDRLTVPLYFPRFWAVLNYQPSAGKAALTVTRVFGDEPLTFTRLTGRPMGRSAAESKTVDMPPFTVKPGAVLDLRPYLNVIGPPILHPSLLSRAGQAPFIEVHPPEGQTRQ